MLARMSHTKAYLVNQLVECMLAIGARFAPHNGAGGVRVHCVARARDALAVALHVPLLEVGGKAMEVPEHRHDTKRNIRKNVWSKQFALTYWS